MEPHIQRGDMLLVVNADINGDGDIEVTPAARSGKQNTHFGQKGDVIIYSPPGERIKVVHRAHFKVSKGENWYQEANKKYVGSADNCFELENCPAPNTGYITKGDNNPIYDQVGGTPISPPVKNDWITAKADIRIPYVGYLRLFFG